MSNLDNIKNNIISEARKEVDNLIAQAKEEAEAKREKMLEGLKKEIDEKEADKEAMTLQIKDRIRTGADREVRNMILQAKQDTVSRAYDLAKKELMAVDDKTYSAIVNANIKNREFDDSTILQIPSFRNFTSDKLKVEKDDKLKSGFRIVSGGIIENYDFDDVVDSLRGTMDATILSLIKER